MKNVPVTVLVGAIVIAVPLMLARAGIDPNDDGCVDLADYAIMQQGFTGPDCGGKTIHSYYSLADGTAVIIPVAPGENGFVITDVICRADHTLPVIVQLTEEFDGGSEVKLRFSVADDRTPMDLHFNSGIPIRPGASVTVSGTHMRDMTISGYTY